VSREIRRSPAALPSSVELGAETGFLRAEIARLEAALAERERADAILRESEERLRTLVEHTFDFVVECSADGRFLYVSSEYRDVLGYEADALLGTSVFAPMHPDDVPEARAAFERGVRERSTDGAVFRYRHENGEWRWFEATGRPFLTASGEVRVIICSRDITDRKRAQDALAEELRVSTGLVRVAREMLSLLDMPEILSRLCQLTAEEVGGDASSACLRNPEGGRLTLMARCRGEADGSAWTGPAVLDLSEESGAALLQRLAHEDLLEVASEGDDALARELAQKLDMGASVHVALRRGDEVIGVQSTGYRQRAASFSTGQRRLAVGIAQIASMTLENARLLERAESANRAKSEFLSTISHELRTPMHIIIGYNDLLLAEEFGPLGRRQHEVLRRIDKSSRELYDLINATLDVGRLETGRLPITVRTFDVAELIGELMVETEDLREQSGLAFGWNVAPELPRLRSDAGKLKLILKNLIGNAIKFTPQGSVNVDALARDGGVTISVSDTGIGIAPSDLSTIFERFRQAARSASGAHGGVGLGLYIVRRTLELLGGTIAVESAVGRGSKFQIWLPVQPPGG